MNPSTICVVTLTFMVTRCLPSALAAGEDSKTHGLVKRSIYSYRVAPSSEQHEFPAEDPPSQQAISEEQLEETVKYADGAPADEKEPESLASEVPTTDEISSSGTEELGTTAKETEPPEPIVQDVPSTTTATIEKNEDTQEPEPTPEATTQPIVTSEEMPEVASAETTPVEQAGEDASTTTVLPPTDEDAFPPVIQQPTEPTTHVSSIVCFVCNGPEECSMGGRAEHCRTRKANGCATSYAPRESFADDDERHVVEKSCSEWAVGNHCEFERDSGPDRQQVCHCRGDKCNDALVPKISTHPAPANEPAKETYNAPNSGESGDGGEAIARRDSGRRDLVSSDWIDETDSARGVLGVSNTKPKQSGPSPYGPMQSCFVCMSPITCAVGGSRYKPCEGEESHTCVTVFADKAAYERVYRSMTFIPKKNNNKWNETVDNPPRRNIYRKQCTSEREIGCRPVTKYGVGTYACFCNANNDCNNEVCALAGICDEKDGSSSLAPFAPIIALCFLSTIFLEQKGLI